MVDSGVETEREVGKRRWIRIEFAEEQCFQFGVKTETGLMQSAFVK